MKTLVATVLLLFQLQSLAGSAACLFSSEGASKPECEMPEQRAATHGIVLESGSQARGCALAFACATSALAVPSLSDGQESVVPFDFAAGTLAVPALTGVASSPPFHPPRA